MATIKPIEGRSVHQIQSGQVIVDLCSVVKELVENSLDAGATSIDVRFKNQGLESIEVQDNGGGISPNNYETLALKHHTSKLSTYSDLTTLQTFGFRGEALSSLCALSKFSVVTCLPQDAPKGTRLEFEISGKLKGTSVVAAQKGTTVLVEELFYNLPVRRRELERNIKREWNKVTGVLGQYACVQTGIKFSVSQQSEKRKKTNLFSTKGNQSTRENIVNVFGAKTLTALVPLDLNLELEATSAPSQRRNTQEDGDKKEIHIVGHISRPASGEGRQTPDRQMFFVNSRPCGLPQVAKVFNEVYKSYNASQSPFIFANIELDTHFYDVNVSPDKRTILLHDQNRMLESLKDALTALFESQDYTLPISQLPAQKQPSYKQLTISRENTAASLSAAPQSPKTIEESVGDESEDGTNSLRREQSADNEETFKKKYNPNFRRGPVSRESVNKAREDVSLISNWVGRKVDERAEVKDALQKTTGAVTTGLSDEKRRLAEKLRKETEETQVVDELADSPESSLVTTQSTDAGEFLHRPLPPVPAVQDKLSERADSETSEEERENILTKSKEPIPALRSPAKPPASIAERFSSTARTQRPPAEIATITIGDQTVTSSIGTSGPKRVRTEAVSTWQGKTHPLSVAKTLPSFGSSLSQKFAAPGTIKQSVSSGEETEEETGDIAPARQLSETTSKVSKDLTKVVKLTERDGEVPNILSSIHSNDSLSKDDEKNSLPATPDFEEDGEYIDETQKKALEEARIQEMIEQAENSATVPSQENFQRTKSLLKGGSKKKDATLHLTRVVNTNCTSIAQRFRTLETSLSIYKHSLAPDPHNEGIDVTQAEEKLSLTVAKTDFAKMRVVGQFNLGFILATRTSDPKIEDSDMTADDLFIIDQHASDEKYNFERLQATTIVQSQRLVQPKTLDLTAMEEEIVMENLPSLEQNGFIVKVDQSGESPVGQRCQLISLPLSRETAFNLSDLQELISLLADHPPGSHPRPSKVRKMFAMRACRSSIMIGKTLTNTQMAKVVKHLGELDKPWNCPHGRPTMRHLCGLGVWDDSGWKEGYDADDKSKGTDWATFLRRKQEEPEVLEQIEDDE